MYCAIIGDIVESKNISDRQSIQNEFQKILDEVNRKYIDSISSKFTITLGDEFQALLNSPRKLFNILGELRENMGNIINMRFGIGFGKITTEINPELAIGADGPAYHNARKAIGQIKSNERKYEKPLTDTFICFETDKNTDSGLSHILNTVNSCLSLCTFIKGKWTDKQKEVLKLAKKDISQREIAQMLNIGQPSVQRSISASGYYSYIDAINTAQESINYIWEKINAD